MALKSIYGRKQNPGKGRINTYICMIALCSIVIYKYQLYTIVRLLILDVRMEIKERKRKEKEREKERVEQFNYFIFIKIKQVNRHFE